MACAAVSGDLQVVGIGAHGAGSNLWHTIRKAGGEWQAKAGNVSDPGHARDFEAVSCTAIGGDLQVIALLDGVLWHTARAASGKWQAGFDAVPTIDGGPLTPDRLRCGVSTTEASNTDDHLDLVLRPGEDHEVVLPSLGSAGYVWQHEVDGDPGVIEVARRRGSQPVGRVAGRATPEVVSIAALAPGTVTIRLRQRRPWESDVEPRSTLRVTVEVRDREPG